MLFGMGILRCSMVSDYKAKLEAQPSRALVSRSTLYSHIAMCFVLRLATKVVSLCFSSEPLCFVSMLSAKGGFLRLPRFCSLAQELCGLC